MEQVDCWADPCEKFNFNKHLQQHMNCTKNTGINTKYCYKSKREKDEFSQSALYIRYSKDSGRSILDGYVR